MPHKSMLTIEELNQMVDLSGATLYRTEVKRIPFLTSDEQAAYVEAARGGDESATHELLLNCLNWTMIKAAQTYRERESAHTDVMDLVGHANVKMLEALPNALQAANPVTYLMGVSAREMKRYCMYRDPLVVRPKDVPFSDPQPVTVSLNDEVSSTYATSTAADLTRREEGKADETTAY